MLCREIVSPLAREKGLTLLFCDKPYTGKLLLGDPARLHQILLNLLSNAIKFTNTGTVELFYEISEISENTTSIYFEVKDTGIGMTGDQLNRIFLPFTQVEEGKTRNYGGAGLGLTITMNFVMLMGGELKVESTYGYGSKFSFEIKFDTIP